MTEQIQATAPRQAASGDLLDIARRRREWLIDYLKKRTEAKDWYQVGVAANELREVEVEIAVRSEPQ